MKLRLVRGAALVAALVLAVVSGPAAQAQTQVATKWKLGPPITFGAPMAGATRFDGELYKPTNRVFFLGFRQSDNSTSGEVWYYDVATKTYVDTGVAMPVPVTNYQIAPLKDATGTLGFYIFGGRDTAGNIVTTTQAYFPATNTTAIDAADPWPGTTPSACVSLPGMGVATVGSSKAYVLGGISFSANGCTDDNSSEVWRFNAKKAPGSRWKKMPSLLSAHGYITPAVLGTKIYAIGGDFNTAGSLAPLTDVESWVVGAGSWTAETALPEACDESQAFAFSSGTLANTITLAGCGQFPAASADVNQYDTIAQTWSLSCHLNTARRNQAGVTLGSKMFVLGGYANDASVLASTEVGKAGVCTTASGASHAPSGASGTATTS